MKQILKFIFSRMVIVGALIVVQLFFLVLGISKLAEYYVYLYGILTVLSLVVIVWLVNRPDNPSYKLAWSILILAVPIFGGLFYLIFGGNRTGKRFKKISAFAQEASKRELRQDRMIMEALQKEDPSAAIQSEYLQKCSGFPIYQNTSTLFLPSGEVKFAYLVEELKKAEHFIFIEYFIIQEGTMWNAILDILTEKAANGLDVRVIYDDIGCLNTLPYRYNEKLENRGIRCCVFNPFEPRLSIRHNNRDHRKICVIDGHTGFTGGINLADEYINAIAKHGHWKDCAIMLKGDAVWSLTLMFMHAWSFNTNTLENCDRMRPHTYHPEPFQSDGFVQPYGDSPLDDELVGESVYLNIINRSLRYLYIATPYLIVDNELLTALGLAAKSGVDVRIITPHVADKWYVHMVTQAYYQGLIEAGVKIYEYAPGFIHSKTFVCDDHIGTVGSINLDYRSLYLHFECGVWLFQSKALEQVRDDFLRTLNVCKRITLDDCRNVNWFHRIVRGVLRVFSPLM